MTIPFGVYLHIPFCSRRCEYCAFATWSDRNHLQEAYLDALQQEIEREVAAGMPVATSVFVGGGTPSLVDPHRLAEVVSSIPIVTGAEVTIECNPESVTSEHVSSYREAGVSRLSFGVQITFRPRTSVAGARPQSRDKLFRLSRLLGQAASKG